MPELPEVQTVVNDLNKRIIGRRIINVWSDWQKTVKKPDFKKFVYLIKEKKILKIERRAKNLLFYLSDDLMMLSHLKMTGHWLIGKWEIKNMGVIPLEPKEVITDPYNKYIHLIFYLDNGKMLALSDLRKFAKILLGTTEEIKNLEEIKKLGPEPLDRSFKIEEFIKLIKSERGKIKQVLMNQEVISGIGNIYADEILWLAKIHPFKPANKLSEKELREVYKDIKIILNKSLKLRGTSSSDYRDTAGKKGEYHKHLLAYQREGEKCNRCGTLIKRVKLGGRSAHYCPKCQKD